VGVVNRHHSIGWEFVPVCIDDASRIAFVQILADRRKESAPDEGKADGPSRFFELLRSGRSPL
jgi:hypothetical protein